MTKILAKDLTNEERHQFYDAMMLQGDDGDESPKETPLYMPFFFDKYFLLEGTSIEEMAKNYFYAKKSILKGASFSHRDMLFRQTDDPIIKSIVEGSFYAYTYAENVDDPKDVIMIYWTSDTEDKVDWMKYQVADYKAR